MTHPFHPLYGRDFEFVAHRQNWGEDLWVPAISSKSRDQAILVDRAADASPPSYAVLLENDRLR